MRERETESVCVCLCGGEACSTLATHALCFRVYGRVCRVGWSRTDPPCAPGVRFGVCRLGIGMQGLGCGVLRLEFGVGSI